MLLGYSNGITGLGRNVVAAVLNTLNASDVPSGTSGTLSNGNRTWTTNTAVGSGATNSNGFTPRPTVPSGAKAYFEFRLDAISIANTGYIQVSVGSIYIWWVYTGTRQIVGTNTTTTFNAGAGQVWSIAVDDTAGKVWFALNGSWQTTGTGTPAPAAGTGAAGTFTPGSAPQIVVAGRTGNSAQVLTFNFGQAAYAYTPPTGFSSF